MPVETDADRAAFFDTDDFGVVATINGESVDGIYDNGYAEVLDVSGTEPMFECRTSDLDAITQTVGRGTVVIVDSKYHEIEVPKNDGTGMTSLVLSESDASYMEWSQYSLVNVADASYLEWV